ncbi:alcohol dehydrogenase catalytic domain-containing protein [Terricaulis silvestris]|uniref:S-(Hydroxymethyl)glutathione dehydrogenase n=1 Tax=Terricaulis silvestris TaxID=2686094 RepID=A0A6I6MLV4_9CAUL|nr:alcohol dehydrogenase catalytic domain-containing protein [Terricaulis silvestris]QGZ93697.1 S-(hydroxymethyl)glutathione dehydrogenase [Terricaulis silvestris]
MEARAAISHSAKAPLTIEAVTLGEPGPGQVLIEAKAAGLCHSDLFVMDGGVPMSRPLIPGHEGAGVVIACGPGVKSLKVGDRVVTCAIGECGECGQCATRRTNLCEKAGLPAMGVGFAPSPHFTLNDGPVSVLAPGAAFASHTIVDEVFATKIPNGVPFDVACLFGCAVPTGVGSVLYTALVEAGASVVVFGLGGVGLNVVDGAQLAGAAQIIGVDANPAKESVGRQFGMTHFIDARKTDDITGAIRDLTGGAGADYAFECVGNIDLGPKALGATRLEWGVLVQIGACPPGRDQLAIPVSSVLSGRSVMGSFFGKSKPRTDIARMMDWFVQGKLHSDALVSHRLPLERINEGFKMMERGESIRTVITFD